jgi:hypothetical protein
MKKIKIYCIPEKKVMKNIKKYGALFSEFNPLYNGINQCYYFKIPYNKRIIFLKKTR